MKEEVKKVLEANGDPMKERRSYQELRKVYQTLIERGLLEKPQYKLPHADTIGRRFVELQQKAKR